MKLVSASMKMVHSLLLMSSVDSYMERGAVKHR